MVGTSEILPVSARTHKKVAHSRSTSYWLSGGEAEMLHIPLNRVCNKCHHSDTIKFGSILNAKNRDYSNEDYLNMQKNYFDAHFGVERSPKFI